MAKSCNLKDDNCNVFFSAHYYTNLCHFIWSTRMTHNTERNSHWSQKKNHIAYIIFEKTHYSENRFLNQSFKHKNHNLKSQKNKKKTSSSRKFLAPLWNSMCQSVLLKHILLCPCMLRAFGKKNWSINFDRWRLRFVPSFCHTKKGYLLCFYEN